MDMGRAERAQLRKAKAFRVLLIGLAIALVAAGTPQLVNAALNLYGDSLAGELGGGNPVSAETIVQTASMLEASDDLLGNPRGLIRAGLLRAQLAFGNPSKLDRAELGDAMNDLKAGLAKAPGNASAWMELANDFVAAGEEEKARKAFRTSILFAGYDPSLSLLRTRLGLVLLPMLDDDDRRLWSGQVRIAWDFYRAGLLALAKQDTLAIPLSIALASDPRRLAAFEEGLAGNH